MSLVIIIAVICFFIWMLAKRRPAGPRIPGPRGWPVIGNTLECNPRTFHYKMEEWAKTFGPMFQCNVLGNNILVLSKPELVRKAFCSDKTALILSDRPPTFLGKYVFEDAKGIVFARNSDRTFKLRQVFHRGMHIYGDGVEKFERTVQEEMRRLIHTVTETNGMDFDPRPVLEISLTNVITILACGELVTGKDSDIIHNFIDTINEGFYPTYEFCMYNIPILRFTPGYFGNLYRAMISRSNDLLNVFYYPYKASYQPGIERGVVDAFIKLQAQNPWLTELQVEGLMGVVFSAGLFTTSNTLVAVFLVLLHHPDCLTRIYEEVMEVVGPDRLPSLSDKPRMAYTEAAIMECQRITNQMHLPTPHNCSEDTEFEGYTIKKNTWIIMNLWTINQDPDVWEEPEKFRPERFLDDDGSLLSPDHDTRKAFLMFGVGKRNCVGEVFARSRMFLYVSTMIQRFELLPPDTEPLVSDDAEGFTPGLITLPPAYKLRAVARKE